MAAEKSRTKTTIIIIAEVLAFMYAVQLINVATNGAARYYGIHPRDPGSLWFLVSSPFIHGDWPHLFNNTVAFVVFSALCIFMKGGSYYARSSCLIVVLGGLLVWVFGRPHVHIGASGWIFGLWAMLIANAWFERSIANFVIAVLVIFFYGGMLFGVLPQQPHISFEAHFFGAVAGIVAAAVFSRSGSKNG